MITVTRTEYSRMPHSINNHTMKYFTWLGITYVLDKETDSSPCSYRLYHIGSGMLLDYFGDGKSWKEVLNFVEGWMTATFGKEV